MVLKIKLSQHKTEDILHRLQPAFSPIAKAESVEGLFNVLVGFCSPVAKMEYFAVGNVLLQLALAENHGAFGSLLLRAYQQDVGSMAPTLHQRGYNENI